MMQWALIYQTALQIVTQNLKAASIIPPFPLLSKITELQYVSANRILWNELVDAIRYPICQRTHAAY